MEIDDPRAVQWIEIGALPGLFKLVSQTGTEVAGVAPHFADIGDTIEGDYAGTQVRWFHETPDVVRKGEGELPPPIHASCSAASLLFHETDFTLARVVIPVGYADEYSFALGNRSRVRIRGRSAQVVRRACMNILMADVTDIPEVAIGDEVILIAKQGEVQVEELAPLSDTVSHVVFARPSPPIPREVN